MKLPIKTAGPTFLPFQPCAGYFLRDLPRLGAMAKKNLPPREKHLLHRNIFTVKSSLIFSIAVMRNYDKVINYVVLRALAYHFQIAFFITCLIIAKIRLCAPNGKSQ
jgi:hypothetical protein